jgi:hypothetical protein
MRPRTTVAMVRLTWVTVINTFFVIVSAFSAWERYAGIGLAKAGFQNIGYGVLAFAMALMLGTVLEAGRIRAAAVVNVGLYAIGAADVCVSAARGRHIDPLIWVVAFLFASISVVNLLLYRSISPLPFGD